MSWKIGRAQQTILRGQAGVWTVAAQLALRGHNVLFPGVDEGYDLQMDNGLRLQVKSASLTYPQCGSYARPNFGVRGGSVRGNYLGGAYGFALRRGAWLGKEKGYQRSLRGYDKVADFFVLWGIDENRFWVVPTSIKNKVIWFGRVEHPNNSNNASYTNKRKLDRIAAYENRWDLLDVNQTVETLVESEPQQVREEK